jgi:hypothetical protein
LLWPLLYPLEFTSSSAGASKDFSVLKHEELHKKFQQIKLHTKSSTVADDVEYTWDVYAQKRLRKGWK